MAHFEHQHAAGLAKEQAAVGNNHHSLAIGWWFEKNSLKCPSSSLFTCTYVYLYQTCNCGIYGQKAHTYSITHTINREVEYSIALCTAWGIWKWLSKQNQEEHWDDDSTNLMECFPRPIFLGPTWYHKPTYAVSWRCMRYLPAFYTLGPTPKEGQSIHLQQPVPVPLDKHRLQHKILVDSDIVWSHRIVSFLR